MKWLVCVAHTRCSLANCKLQKIVFINDNFHICKSILDKFKDELLELEEEDA